jgi:hypothetical protein
MLNVRPIANYNTSADGPIQVTYRATDRAGANFSRNFMVTVRPVNDAPAAFNLLTPANNTVIAYADSASPVTISWEVAVQNQWEVDSVRIRHCILAGNRS